MSDRDNSENDAWNLVHGGNRVPVNDTDSPGAPFATKSSDPAWEEGSWNRAFKAYMDENGWTVLPEDQADFDAGIMSMHQINKYGVVYSAQWGYKGDSRYKKPGDQMSARGLPTSEVFIEFDTASDLVITEASGDFYLDGFIIKAKIPLKLPFPIEIPFSLRDIKRGDIELTTPGELVAKGSVIIAQGSLEGSVNNLRSIVLSERASGDLDFNLDLNGEITDDGGGSHKLPIPQYCSYGDLDTIIALTDASTLLHEDVLVRDDYAYTEFERYYVDSNANLIDNGATWAFASGYPKPITIYQYSSDNLYYDAPVGGNLITEGYYVQSANPYQLTYIENGVPIRNTGFMPAGGDVVHQCDGSTDVSAGDTYHMLQDPDHTGWDCD